MIFRNLSSSKVNQRRVVVGGTRHHFEDELNRIRRTIHAFVTIAFLAAASGVPVSSATAQTTAATITRWSFSASRQRARHCRRERDAVCRNERRRDHDNQPRRQLRVRAGAAGVLPVGIESDGFGATRVNDVVGAGAPTAVPRSATPPLFACAACDERSSLPRNGRTTSGVGGITGPPQLPVSTTSTKPDSATRLPQSGGRPSPSYRGVNLTGGPHTVGETPQIDIRGMGAGELRPLLGGHPIGGSRLAQDY